MIPPGIDDPDDDLAVIVATGAIRGLVDPGLLRDAIIYTPFEDASGTETIRSAGRCQEGLENAVQSSK